MADAPPVLSASVTVEFGPDRGQNYGSLWEVRDAQGRVVAGAGFMGAYNTQPRGDRELLQVFVRPPQISRAWEIERLPAIDGPATGYYPFGMKGQLYVHNRSEKGRLPADPNVYRWDADAHRWAGEPDIQPYSERVAGKVLEVTGVAVTYDGRTLLTPMPGARFGEHYFAGGNLLLKEANLQSDPPLNRLVVCPWRPESDGAIHRRGAWTLELPIQHEFIYTFGQWRDQVIAVSNNGRAARFSAGGWTILREPVPNVSYQIYAGLTHHERLLLGHYPTGELYEYSGRDLKLLKGWPPVLQGVSPSAREAQTLGIYGGEIYAGVWPWGELWRYDEDHGAWAFVDRMFSHPLPSSSVVHPYEVETRRVDPVANLWGQRVTGLTPHGPSLAITTSSKASGPWEPKFDFLTARQRADYGATYLATVPGNLAVATTWKPGPTRFEVAIAGRALTVSQDGQALGAVELPESFLAAFAPAQAAWGRGVFGPCAGKIIETSTNLEESAKPNQ